MSRNINVFNDELQCYLEKIIIRNKILIEFYFPDGGCCDMDGAIKLAERILPTVEKIQTYSDDLYDVLYLKLDKDWKPYFFEYNIREGECDS